MPTKSSLNQIKLLRKLNQRKHREKEQLFIVEGERAVEQIIENRLVEVVSVFVNETKTSALKSFEVSTFELEHSIMAEVSNTETPQGVLAVCKMPQPISTKKISAESGVIVATDAIQDPGNLGTIIRTASWFGCKAILLGTGTVDLFNPKVVRSTVGATGSIPFLAGNLDKILKELENDGWETLLLDGNSGSIPLNQHIANKKTILVVGNEANGINKTLISQNRKRVLIPPKNATDSVESLNASIALSIALWSVNN